MSKYKQADALKIKQEIAALQTAKARLEDDIIDRTEQLEMLQRGVATWRGIFKRVEESFAAKLDVRLNQLQTAEAQISEKESKSEALDTNLANKQQLMAALKESIRDARETKHEDQTSFLSSVLRNLQSKIAEGFLQKKNLTGEIKHLQDQQRAVSADLNKLHVEKTGIVNQIQELFHAILEGKKQLKDVLHDIEKHQATIKTIESREHDSRVMLMRLSEKYRAVYKQHSHGTLDTRV